ncbi:MAG: hypothetical protein FJ170_05255 [Gammaproteobacteria bacterium]|nr:hypothetical protein [Gammaproteobacteria bacterium]
MSTAHRETELIPVTSLQEFFRDSVDAAMASNKVAVDDHTAHYVVNLLTVFVRSEALHDQMPAGPRLQPLALMLANAAESPSGEERNMALRRLGDVALFVAGFMAGCLDRSPVGINYYVRMGGGAYHCLAASLPSSVRGRAIAPVYAELSARFVDLVDVLTEVRHVAAASRDRDVLRLYELWLTTGSQRAARLLRLLGIEPSQQPGSDREH